MGIEMRKERTDKHRTFLYWAQRHPWFSRIACELDPQGWELQAGWLRCDYR